MNFTPESLIQIYLEGSFTEEAQAEFDALMRKDPLFAERVTTAVSQRLGQVPDGLVDRVSANLDGKMEGLWQKNKPSLVLQYGKTLAKAVLVLAVLAGLGWGLKHLAPVWKSMTASNAPEVSQAPTDSSSAVVADDNEITIHVPTKAMVYRQASKAVAPVVKPAVAAQPTLYSSAPPLPVLDAPAVSAPAAPAPKAASSHSEEGDALRVSIETKKTQNVTITVVDSNGILIRHLYQGVWKAGIHLIDWDGKDEFANSVLPGDYTVVVDADGKKMSGVVTIQPNK